MARLLRFAAVAVLVGGATAFLSGCTGDADPVVSVSPRVTAEVTPSPSPSVSVSPTPTALSDEELLELIPSAARTDSFAGASEFVEFMLQQYESVYQSGDPSLWEAVSADTCGFCASVVQESRALVEAGGHREGGVISVTDDLGVGAASDDGFTYISRTYSATETRDIDANGDSLGVGPAGTGTASFKLRFEEGVWIVYGVETVGD